MCLPLFNSTSSYRGKNPRSIHLLPPFPSIPPPLSSVCIRTTSLSLDLCEEFLRWKLFCDMCEKRQATVICYADEATLCAKCDVEVHAANKLASKHQRIQLHTLSTKLPTCDICQVLLIGGSTGTMLEALEVVGDDHEVNLGEEG